MPKHSYQRGGLFMPGIDVKVIEELDHQIVTLKEAIEKAGNKGRENLKSINVEEARQPIVDASGKFDANLWEGLKDKQQEVYDRLSLVFKHLRGAAGLDGPKDPKHIMFDDYASNTAIIGLAIVSFGLMVLLLGAVILLWNHANDKDLARKMQAAKPLFAILNNAKKDAEAAQKELEAAQKELSSAKEEAAKKKLKEAKPAPQEGPEPAAGEQTGKPPEEAPKNLEGMTKEQDEAQKNLGLLTKKQADAQKALEVMTTKQAKAQTEVNKAMEEIPLSGATEDSILTMIVLLGALGGTLHLVSSLFKYVGNRQFKRSWVLYYLAMPLTGAGLAPVVYLLLRVGIISPSQGGAGDSSLANLNLIFIYAFALLTGMFSRAATDKLGEVFNTIFKTGAAPSKDALGAKKPPQGAAPGGGATP
jgi:hypothetical protein